jgi:hypothetical protein
MSAGTWNINRQSDARSGNEPEHYGISFCLTQYWSLSASLIWAKLFLGRFRDAVSLIFSISAGSTAGSGD